MTGGDGGTTMAGMQSLLPEVCVPRVSQEADRKLTSSALFLRAQPKIELSDFSQL
jgi:hypothetical protein